MGQRRMQLSEQDRRLLAWCGEQDTLRFDLLGVLMARMSDDAAIRARGRMTHQAVSRRVRGWKQGGLVEAARTILAGEPATIWLTADGMLAAGLPWRTYEPTVATVAHRHALGVIPPRRRRPPDPLRRHGRVLGQDLSLAHPAARQSSTTLTVTRVPATLACPCRTCGSLVIRAGCSFVTLLGCDALF